jgi:hypothetical protein
MIRLKLIFVPSWMCPTPHLTVCKKFISLCVWPVDLYVGWTDEN